MKLIGVKKVEAGWLLVEVLIVLAIAGIFWSVSNHYWHSLVFSNQVSQGAERIRVALEFARASAIGLGEKVVFCASLDQQHCGGFWEDGQIVVTESGKILRVLPRLTKSERLVWRANLARKERIEFLPDGTTNGYWGSFFYCAGSSNRNYQARSLIVNVSGSSRVSTKDAKGRSVTCEF